MKNGLATWNYLHRSVSENVAFFSEHGFDAVSILGDLFVGRVLDAGLGDELASVIRAQNVTVTVHHKLPKTHTEEDVIYFKTAIDKIAAWQNKHGLLEVLSFDVPQRIRDNITGYVAYVLEQVKGAKIAVEDFGLHETERRQLEAFKGEPRFGMLMDMGHMHLRLSGKNKGGYTIFSNSPSECEASEKPGYSEFFHALKQAAFPIVEVHLHNNNGEWDQHCLLEDGICDITEVARALKDVGFDGVLTIESNPRSLSECEGEEADRRILHTFAFWKQCLCNIAGCLCG